MTEIVRRLLTFANQSRESDERGCPLAAIQLAKRLGSFSMPRTVRMEVDVPDALASSLLGTGPLSQVLLNLIINAGDALESSGTESPVVKVCAREVPGFVEIEVIDNGPGVPEGLHHSIFEPFYTSKEPGKGTGLGLAISRRIIEDVGGCLMVLSSDPGACFRIRIPTTIDAPSPSVEEEPTETMGGRLLIIDDEPALRRVLRRLLQDEWHIEEAGDGAQAVEIITAGFKPDAIICDVCMPGMNGQGFINWLEENRPDLISRLVWLTGGTLDRHALQTVRATDRPMLSKPPRFSEVREALSAAATSNIDPHADRREHPRTSPSGLTAIVDASDASHPAEVLDISMGGMRLRNGALPTDTLSDASIRILIGPATGPFTAVTTRLAWRSTDGAGRHEYGMQLAGKQPPSEYAGLIN